MSTETEILIDVTGVDLRALIRAAYDLSVPRGLGFLHFKECELPDADVDEILAAGRPPFRPVSMDYVRGRAVKLGVQGVWNRPEYADRLFIRDRWYDHSTEDHAELLRRIGRDGAEHRITVTHVYEDSP